MIFYVIVSPGKRRWKNDHNKLSHEISQRNESCIYFTHYQPMSGSIIYHNKYEHPEISLNCIQTTKTTAHDALQQTSILYII